MGLLLYFNHALALTNEPRTINGMVHQLSVSVTLTSYIWILSRLLASLLLNILVLLIAK